MGRTLDEVIATFTQAERRDIDRRFKAILEDEAGLKALRRTMRRTQSHVARGLGTPQASVSRIERRRDLLLSTLRDYVAALGGKLHLVAELPGRGPVRIAGFDERRPKRVRR